MQAQIMLLEQAVVQGYISRSNGHIGLYFVNIYIFIANGLKTGLN